MIRPEAASRARILCVDDEPLILKGFELQLKRHFDVVTATSGAEGLRILSEQGPFTAVISDFRMPGMDGATFLGRAREISPDTVRLLLTGEASLEGAIAAVNRGQIFRFLTKPCSPTDLHSALADAVEYARLVSTDRRNLGQKLNEITAFWHLVEESSIPKWVLDAATLRFLNVNEAAIQFYGYSHEEFLTMQLSDIEPSPDAWSRMSDDAGNLALRIGICKQQKKGGARVEVDVVAHRLRFDGRDAIMAMGHDVTLERRAEQQLRQAQKMEAVGQLAGGIAHDFNNILSVVLSYSEFAAADLGENHPVTADVREITAAANRAAALTRQLLAFSRQHPRKPSVVNLNTVVAEMQKMLRRVIGENIAMVATPSVDLFAIEADAGQLEQILVNLVVNARDAMPHGGKLLLETANVHLDRAAAQMVGVNPGDYAMLAVSDDGCGMSAEVQRRIFEPFFTTKDIGKGTGLGLSTVFGIVTHHGGGITVYSEPGRGSTFKVYLPARGPSAEQGDHPSVTVDAEKGSGIVLVVEDDPQVRSAVRRLLTDRGYAVLDAADPNAALAVLRDERQRIDLVVSDLVMPGMDGPTMVARARLSRPLLKVLYMSGYTERAAINGAPMMPMDPFVAKPFTMAEMASAVRRVLAGKVACSEAHALEATP